MWSTPSLLLLPDPLWHSVVVPIRVSPMGQIELFNHLTMCKQMTDFELNCQEYLKPFKEMSFGLFKNIIYKLFICK